MITQQQYIEHLEEMIATPGWSIFIEDSKREIYEIQAAALEATTWDHVQRMRGRADQLSEIINLEDMVANQRMEMEMEEVPDADL